MKRIYDKIIPTVFHLGVWKKISITAHARNIDENNRVTEWEVHWGRYILFKRQDGEFIFAVPPDIKNGQQARDMHFNCGAHEFMDRTKFVIISEAIEAIKEATEL